MMREMNWRLRPDIAQAIDKPKTSAIHMEEEHIKVLDGLFSIDQ